MSARSPPGGPGVPRRSLPNPALLPLSTHPSPSVLRQPAEATPSATDKQRLPGGAAATATDATMDEGTDDIIAYHFTDDGSGAGDEEDAAANNSWAALQNKNVSRVLIFCFLDGASHSIWRMDAFQVLVKNLADDKAVGWMSGASGITQMLAALGAGYVGSGVKHETVLRFGSIMGFITVALSMIAAAKLSVPLFFVSQAFSGVYSGICATTTEAIFADSVATGRRAFVYNLKWMDQTLCQCVGLVISICVLFSLGNQWETPALVKTMFVGLCLHPSAMATLWTLRDKYSLKDDEDSSTDNPEVPIIQHVQHADDAALPAEAHMRKSASEVEMLHAAAHTLHDGDRLDEKRARVAVEDTPWSSGLGRPSAMRRGEPEGAAEVPGAGRRVHWSPAPPAVAAASPASPSAADDVTPTASPSGRPPRSRRQKAVQSQLEEECEAAKQAFYADMAAARGDYVQQARLAVAFYTKAVVTWEAVPYLVCLVDFLVAFGSGMTMRFMSLFLVKDYGATPVTLLTASLLISPLQALISYIVQRGGDFYVGRLPSTIIARLIGTTLLLLMGTTNLPLNVMLPVYIFRNALMNSTRGVTRSVIMDCVRKENRAKWSAFESFSSFTWAGSAVFGGYLAAAQGYKGTFKVTAFFHYCSLAVLVPGAIGALPVELELMRANRRKPHASCLFVTVAVVITMAVSSGLYVWMRSAITKRGW